MSELDRHSEDAPFVERVRELTEHPGLDARERVAFQARLDARLEAGRSAAWRRPLAGLAAGVAAAGLVWLALPVDAPVAEGSEATPAFADAMLSLSEDASGETPSALPADYAAIEGLFFDG